jgi:hypothetical protein
LRVSGPVFLFYAPGLVFGGTMASGPVFMFCAPGLIFDFRRYRVRWVTLSCFARPDSFSEVSWASGYFFLVCAPGHVFGSTGLVFVGTDDFGSRFHVLRARTLFRRCRVRLVSLSCFARPFSFSAVRRAWIPFSCFARRDSFSAEPRASCPVLIFCATGLIFDGTKGVGSLFHVLHDWTRFRRGRVRRVPFSCFARPFSFSAVPRKWDPVFMFCAPGLFFGGTEGVGSRFHVLRSRTRFRWYRGRRVPFSFFALSDSFSAVSSASGLVFMFCAPVLIFSGTEGVGSHFHVWRYRTHFRRY